MGDLISRQALCEYALNQKDKSVTPNDIMRFPSTQQWIPISEQMPPLRTEVLATSDGYVTIAEWRGGDKWFIQEGNANATTEDVEAWMELPQPYEVNHE